MTVAGEARERLSPRVAKQVRDLILTGAVRGGERLRTEHLAERLGVSATPVREALMALAGEGMVDFRPGRGFRVIPVTRRDVVDVYAMQAYVSGELAARAAEAFDPAGLARLDDLQREIEKTVRDGDLDATERADFALHRMVNHAAAAPKFTWMLSLTLRYVPFSAYADIPGWPILARDDHDRVLAALNERKPEAAGEAMAAHIREAGDLLVDFLAAQGVLAEH
ncbi:DNA-binding GntR family transcriptional regulator [Amycolatopsis echigonensis]|uniref:DNA-binding GntR family transcriptional regulator n=1 Tax=Amycolatopsis echigonensis TaxID=2576905 RepID=A0A2N3WRV9_9PSEU|nr:GntR family transcriptional regulator [Amycolatopsis niigatensis]PKV96606.1 DNA-binding GntR family transcriptional regulator [Amycolatopsis niigatensis]